MHSLFNPSGGGTRTRARAVSLAGAAALLAMLLPATAGVASAHNYSESLTCVNNVPKLTISLSNYASNKVNSVTITIDGTLDTADSEASFGTSYSLNKVLSPATLPHSAEVVVVGGDGIGSHTWNGSVAACQKASPTISTVASPSTGTVGVLMTVGDTATLSGGNNPSGSVTFTLYSDSDCHNATSISGSGAIAAGVASYSHGWTPTSSGAYYWGVNYRVMAATRACMPAEAQTRRWSSPGSPARPSRRGQSQHWHDRCLDDGG